MKLRDLIHEMRCCVAKVVDPEEAGDFGLRGRADSDRVVKKPEPKKEPEKPCEPGTIRQRLPDGSSHCVALRGMKRF